MNDQLEKLSEGLTLKSRSGHNSIKLEGGKLIITSLDSCADQIIELGSYSPEPFTDWSKVAVDTPVIVTDNQGVEFNRYFRKEHANGNVSVFDYGSDSYSGNLTLSTALDKLQVRIDEEQLKKQQSESTWIKNTGVNPDNGIYVMKLRNGKLLTGKNDYYTWRINNHLSDIVEYIKLPD